LLENAFTAGTGAAVGEELFARETAAAGFVDAFDEAVFDGVGHGDAEVDVPGIGGLLDRIFEF